MFLSSSLPHWLSWKPIKLIQTWPKAPTLFGLPLATRLRFSNCNWNWNNIAILHGHNKEVLNWNCFSHLQDSPSLQKNASQDFWAVCVNCQLGWDQNHHQTHLQLALLSKKLIKLSKQLIKLSKQLIKVSKQLIKTSFVIKFEFCYNLDHHWSFMFACLVRCF